VSVIPPVEGIKIISCRPRHADALQSTPVAHDREGHDFRETKRCEGVPKRGRCSFAGVAAPQHFSARRQPTSTHGREVRFEGGRAQADKPDELRNTRRLDRPKAEVPLGQRLPHARGEIVALLQSERVRKMPHDASIAVQSPKRRQIVVAPMPEHEAAGG
jgi:hypothetical protein